MKLYQYCTSLLLLCSLCSCGKTGILENNLIQNYPINHYSTHANTYQNGAIYIASENGSRAAYFIDYKTLQSVPLCNKPNCTHHDNTCLAHQCVQQSVLPVVYQDHVYWFSTSSQIVEEENGNNSDYIFQTTCYQGDLATGDMKEFVKIPDVSMQDTIQLVIVEDIMYVIGCDQAFQEEDGSWTEMSRIGDQYLYAINLMTAEVKNYGLINDASTAYYNWTTEGGVLDAEVMLTGVFQGKLYMSYRYVDDRNDITDYLSSINYDDPNWSWIDSVDVIPYHQVNKCLDLETGEMEISDLPIAEAIEGDYYVYYDETFCVIDANGNHSKSSEIVRDGHISNTVIGKKFWKGSQNLCFDLETGEDIPLAEKYQGKDITVLDLYEGEYIIQYLDENYAYVFESVPEEELLVT